MNSISFNKIQKILIHDYLDTRYNTGFQYKLNIIYEKENGEVGIKTYSMIEVPIFIFHWINRHCNAPVLKERTLKHKYKQYRTWVYNKDK